MPEKLKKLYLNAGQMKAGTTYLYSVLGPHRSIYFSPEKEIHYLSQRFGTFRILSDGVRLRKAKSIVEIANKLDRPIERYQWIINWAGNYLRSTNTDGWYEDMFQGHRDGQWCADFSNLTCTIPVEGLRQVAGIADDVRVTYCIRDAVSRAISHAKFHLRFAGEEHDLSAFSPEKLRALLLSDNILPQSKAEEHISALHQVFGDEKLRIIRCESLWSDPKMVVDAVCDFLEVGRMDGDIARDAVNVGPSSTMTDDVRQVFEEVFGHMRQSHEALLQRHSNIVIG